MNYDTEQLYAMMVTIACENFGNVLCQTDKEGAHNMAKKYRLDLCSAAKKRIDASSNALDQEMGID